MEYQKIANLLDNGASNPPSKFRTKNWVEINDIKNISHIDTSSFALKPNLASLNTEVDKFYIDILVPVPVDLSKLNDVVKNDVVKKVVHDN